MSTKLFYGLLLLLAVYCICDVVADDDKESASSESSDVENAFYHPETNETFPQLAQLAISNPFKAVSFYGANCNCANKACDCCTGIRIKSHNFDKRACAIVKYLPQEIGLGAQLTVDQKQIASKSVSLSNPPAICARVPDFPFVQLCVHFYNLSKNGDQVHGCIDLEARVKKIRALKLHFKCFTI
ncbi:uncharacterized protein LOC100880374 isoform X1 [Megachile rotundata]|uniref:uncharacterized protein LOC100880374 isoform X1 n=1 Tax=Megachile rotundata TaxID=143995 RepID=UPI003FD3E4A0